ncbi:MAG: hypothetical protein V1845_03355 [bacterium]
MQQSKLFSWAVINSLGTLAYIVIVALFLNNGEKLFGNGPDSVLAPVAMLLLLVLSATITGALVLGRPAYMYFSGQKQEAVKLLVYTVGCLFVAMLIVFAVIVAIK